MTQSDLLTQYRLSARAIAHAAAGGEPDIEKVVALRLVRGELCSRAWDTEIQPLVGALVDEVNRAVQSLLRAWQWDGLEVEQYVLSWLMRQGPRRFYAWPES